MSLNQVLTSLQISLIVLPVIAYIVTKRMCLSLQRKDREIVLHGRESGRIVRLPHGEYVEVHTEIDEYTRYKLVDFVNYEPMLARPNSRGKITVRTRLRAAMSRWFFEDRVAPVTPAELEEAKKHSVH
jgi:ubiquinol-cytochrome c reductase cytochrome b subunit